MNNQKMNPIRTVVKLFQTTGRTQTIEKNLKAASKTEVCYMMPMPRI